MCLFANPLQCDLCFKQLHVFFITNPRNGGGGGGKQLYYSMCKNIVFSNCEIDAFLAIIFYT